MPLDRAGWERAVVGSSHGTVMESMELKSTASQSEWETQLKIREASAFQRSLSSMDWFVGENFNRKAP